MAYYVAVDIVVMVGEWCQPMVDELVLYSLLKQVRQYVEMRYFASEGLWTAVLHKLFDVFESVTCYHRRTKFD